jgi:hypothetical protein
VLSKRESEEFAEDDRIATERANKRGRHFSIEAPHAAIFAALGVYILLDVFAALTLPDRESAFWPLISLTVIVAAVTYIVVRQREKRWLANYHEELEHIRAGRAHRRT